jgi:glycosyltransferase 2 family protein
MALRPPPTFKIRYNFATMRKLIIAIVLFIGAAFIILRFAELHTIADTLRNSNFNFLIAALIMELIWMYNSAVKYGVLYRLMGLEEKPTHLVLVATAANFVNIIAPTAGIGGMAVFLDDARKRDHSTGRVTVVGFLYILFDYLAFLLVLALGLIVLFRRNNLNAGELTASGLLVLVALGLGGLLYLGYRSAEQLGKALAWLARLINRIVHPFLRREYLKEADAQHFANEIYAGVQLLRGKRKSLFWPLLFSLNSFAILLCVLALTFLALGTPFTVGTLVGGFSISYLFLIVSPTPSGLGVMEGMMSVALYGLRVRWEAAVLITLTYRFVTFWFPLIIGAIAFRTLGGRKKKPAPVLDHPAHS